MKKPTIGLNMIILFTYSDQGEFISSSTRVVSFMFGSRSISSYSFVGEILFNRSSGHQVIMA